MKEYVKLGALPWGIIAGMIRSLAMGITHVKAWIYNLNEPTKQTELEFMVDSGAIYTVITGRIAEDIGIIPHSRRVFELADGRKVTWPVANAGFRIGDHQGASIVIFGEESTPALLGVTALETLGLGLDPVRKELRSIPLPLM